MFIISIALKDDLKKNLNFFLMIRSFSSFSIPEYFYKTERENQIELINGLLDSCGFANPGAWIGRKGSNGFGRQRIYFQIINAIIICQYQ